jgi:hypothetical protein
MIFRDFRWLTLGISGGYAFNRTVISPPHVAKYNPKRNAEWRRLDFAFQSSNKYCATAPERALTFVKVT